MVTVSEGNPGRAPEAETPPRSEIAQSDSRPKGSAQNGSTQNGSPQSEAPTARYGRSEDRSREQQVAEARTAAAARNASLARTRGDRGPTTDRSEAPAANASTPPGRSGATSVVVDPSTEPPAAESTTKRQGEPAASANAEDTTADAQRSPSVDEPEPDDATKTRSWRERLGFAPKTPKSQPVDVPPTGPGVPTAAGAAGAATAIGNGHRLAAASAAPSASTHSSDGAAQTATGGLSAAERPTTYRNPPTPGHPTGPTPASNGPDTAVIPAAAAPPAPATAATTVSLAPRKPGAGVARRTRKARLRLSRLDPWSVMKTSLLFSIAAGIVFVVAVYGVWTLLSASGLFASVDDIVKSGLSTPGDTTPFRVEEYVNTQKVMGVTVALAVFDVLIFTALATLGSFLYNLAATVLGGLEVTLAED